MRWSIGVAIPARDEELRIDACLTALGAARYRVRGVADVRVVVVADRCQDATVEVARRALADAVEVVETDVGDPGAARAIGVGAVLASYDGRPDRLWLANTDADTIVPPAWLEDQLQHANRGVVAVAGIVAVDSFADHPPHVPVRWRALYEGPIGVAHPHVHGANLGVRADAYLAVGGWHPGSAGEDQRLWKALKSAGHVVASPASLVVTTSGRAHSRVCGGFADSLNVLAEAS